MANGWMYMCPRIGRATVCVTTSTIARMPSSSTIPSSSAGRLRRWHLCNNWAWLWKYKNLRHFPFIHRILVLFTALFEIAFSDHFERAAKLKVDASHRRIIGCVTKISRDVKGFFNAESVVLQKAPSLLNLRNDFAETH